MPKPWPLLARVWLGVLFAFLVNDLFALARRVPDIPEHPVGTTLWATFSWFSAVVVLWGIDVQCQVIDRLRGRPRNLRVVRGGETLPVRLRSLGLDPFGYHGWVIINLILHFDDELLADDIPHDTAIYLVGEGGLVRVTRND